MTAFPDYLKNPRNEAPEGRATALFGDGTKPRPRIFFGSVCDFAVRNRDVTCCYAEISNAEARRHWCRDWFR